MKKLSILLAMLMIAALLAGCAGTSLSQAPSQAGSPLSSPGASTPSSGEPDASPVSIRILTRLSSTQPNAVAFRDMVQKFRDENPHITVEDLSIEDESSFNTKLTTAVGSGEVPELFATYGGASFVNYAKNNVALDLTSALDADPEWKDGFLPVFENFQFEDIAGTYAVPYEFFAIAIFYNKDLFAQIGEQPPSTIEEFEAVSEKFISAGIVPMALGEKDPFRGGHLIANLINKKLGAESNMDIAKRSLNYNDPKMVELFALMSDWEKKGYFGNNPVTFDHEAEKAMFHSGQTAMHMNGSWYVPEATESAIADKIGVIAFPYFMDNPENKEVWMGGAGGAFAISGQADADKQAAAIELLKYVTNLDAFKYYQKVQKGGIFPAKVESDPSIVDKLTIEYSSLLTSAQYKAEVYSYDPLPQMLDKVRNEIQGMFAGQPPQATADNIQAEIDKNS